jgi:hypothetical protein
MKKVVTKSHDQENYSSQLLVTSVKTPSYYPLATLLIILLLHLIKYDRNDLLILYIPDCFCGQCCFSMGNFSCLGKFLLLD